MLSSPPMQTNSRRLDAKWSQLKASSQRFLRLGSQIAIAQRDYWLLLIPLFLLTFWLGCRQLNADSVWWDELASMRDAGLLHHSPDGLIDIWNRVGTNNPWHVPGFFMLLNGWSRLVGFDPAALRALSLFVGLLAVAWTYRLGREFVSHKVGLYAAMILGSSAFFIYYLHELRMYTLFALFSAFTLWVYLRILRARKVTRWHWIGLFAGALGLLYTHYFAALLLGVIGLYHLWITLVPRARKLLPQNVPDPDVSAASSAKSSGWLRAMRPYLITLDVLALAGLCFVPWLSVLIEALRRASNAETLRSRALTPLETIQHLGFLFSQGAELALVVLLVAALVAAWRSPNVRRAWFFAAGLLAVLLITNAIVEVMHGGRLRYLMALWPLMAVLVAVGLLALGRRYAWVLLGLWIIWAIMNGSNPSFGDLDGTQVRFPSHRVEQLVAGHTLPSDVVVNFVADLDYRSNYMGALYFGNVPTNYAYVKGRSNLDVDFAHVGDREGRRISLRRILEQERVWLATMPDDTTGQMRQLTHQLAQDYRQCRVIQRPEVHIVLYAIAPVCCMTDNPPLRFTFGDGISLVDGNTIQPVIINRERMTLMWAITGNVEPHRYSVSVQVFDSEGNKVAQDDYGLEAQAFTCHRTFLDLSSLPDGMYEARVIVYAWETGERLQGTVLATGETGEALLLGTFEKLTAGQGDTVDEPTD